jgi:hypothetical protein
MLANIWDGSSCPCYAFMRNAILVFSGQAKFDEGKPHMRSKNGRNEMERLEFLKIIVQSIELR